MPPLIKRSGLSRRYFLAAAAGLALPFREASAEVVYPLPQARTLVFPADHGAHPEFRVEWWYLTGWLQAQGVAPFGFQLTFFQVRPGVAERNPSRFAPRHILIAHAALAWPAAGHLLHDARSARTGFGLVEAAEGDCNLRLDRWRLWRERGVFHGRIAAREFAFDLDFRETAPMLQGNAGLSQKSPSADHASHYVSLPHLPVSGAVSVAGKKLQVGGEAWFDHEWSSAYLHRDAVGWDWTGINLDDGSALMLFRIRNTAGGALWQGGTLQSREGSRQRFAHDEITWIPRRTWRSPRTGARYPVEIELRFGKRSVLLVPLMDDQELDSRSSTGAIYWEGAVRAFQDRQPVGRGYLELTGYPAPLKL